MLVPKTNTRVRCTGDDESAPKTRDSTRRRCIARSKTRQPTGLELLLLLLWASRAPQRTLGRAARSRPATGNVTATDRYVLLIVVCGPSVAKKGLRASAGALADLPLFSDKQWHCSPCGAPAKSGRQKPSTGLVLTSPRRLFDDDTSESRSASTLSAAGDRRPMASSVKICADPLDRRVASVPGVHRPGHLLQLALVGL